MRLKRWISLCILLVMLFANIQVCVASAVHDDLRQIMIAGGNRWSSLPTDEDIAQAFQNLPSDSSSSDYRGSTHTYQYTSPKKVYVQELEENDVYGYYRLNFNQVLVICNHSYSLYIDTPDQEHTVDLVQYFILYECA